MLNTYYDGLSSEIKKYFKVLEPKFPEWLHEYIDTDVMLFQRFIKVTCGVEYSKLFKVNSSFSNLDHSIGVALICWHFTHDKKQTIAGLFHDIATPVFKHCVDFMNKDYMKQETTEELTSDMIKNSDQIRKLLRRDGISLKEVDNYHIYPIADNDIPKLSADRLEYSLSNSLFTYGFVKLSDIRRIYNDITIQTNEEGREELSFGTKKIARDFIRITSKLSLMYREDKTRYSMQLIADILKRLIDNHKLDVKDLYRLTGDDIVKIIEKSKYRDIFDTWRNAKKIKVSKEKPKDVYYVHQAVKVRYVDPLFNGMRMSKSCEIAKKLIDKNLAYDMNNYVYLDFNFGD